MKCSEMSRKCDMCIAERRRAFGVLVWEREHLENIGVDGRIILRWMLKA